MNWNPMPALGRGGPAWTANAVVANAPGVFEPIQILERGLGVLAAGAEVVPELRKGHRTTAVDEGQGALDEGTPGFRGEVDAGGDLYHLSQIFQRGEGFWVEPMLMGTGRGVRLRPDRRQILVGRRAPGRVECHAERWQAEGCPVVDQ